MQRWLIWVAEPLSTPPFPQRKLDQRVQSWTVIRPIDDGLTNAVEAENVIEHDESFTFFHG